MRKPVGVDRVSVAILVARVGPHFQLVLKYGFDCAFWPMECPVTPIPDGLEEG